jgi:hypothetical protein
MNDDAKISETEKYLDSEDIHIALLEICCSLITNLSTY